MFEESVPLFRSLLTRSWPQLASLRQTDFVAPCRTAKRSWRSFLHIQLQASRLCSTGAEKEESASEDEEEEVTEPPEFPSNCCGNGCPNCVMFEYMEKLEKYEQYKKKQREKANAKKEEG